MKKTKAISTIGNGYTMIDLFAGIGGFHKAFHDIGVKCVFASEWDKNARMTYEANWCKVNPELFDSGRFVGDITEITKDSKTIKKNIPQFNILTGGFPCQPFSQAGFKKGFEDTRGTLFFDIAKILEERKPDAFFIENVRHFAAHDEGRTLERVSKVIDELGYTFKAEIVKASDHGLPQHRPRLYMIGFRKKLVGSNFDFNFPERSKKLKYTMSDVLGGQCNKEIGYTLRLGGRGSGLGDRRNWDTYLVDGKEKQITKKEGLKMMGLDDDFIFPVSDAQAMRQLGNSVAVDAIRAVALEVVKVLNQYGKR
jgi:DNA (cytosine-5)-methyltransferase 1